MKAAWNTIANHVLDWAPALIALIIGIGAVGLVDRILRSRLAHTGKRNLNIIGPIIVLLLSGVVVVTTILLLPIESAPQGQLLQLIGLLVTAAIALSSTTFLGNALAGIMLRAIRNFRAGDYLRVGEHAGRVSERGILHTEIQTEDRDLTTLPNLYLVTHPVTVLRSSGTVVSATVSLGYDIPHGKVEELLTEASRRAGLTDPFTQVVELGDWSITYRAAGFLTEVKHLLSARSRIRTAMLDALNEADIEIVSPTFMNQRLLAEGTRFIPKAIRPLTRATTAQPEERIFDKAEEAEIRDRLRSTIEEQQRRIQELEERLAAGSLKAETEAIATELEEAQARLDTMNEIVESKDSDD